MSTSIEVATAALQQAVESLKIAEEEMRNWRSANPKDFTSAGYLFLYAELNACRTILSGAQTNLAGAQRNYDSAAQIDS